jgi:DNA-binding MarR family transcriptional regulator
MSISAQQTFDDLLGLLEIFKRSIRDLGEKEGLTNMQVAALYIIHRQETTVMGDVAGKLHCDASNVTGIIDRLVAQGFVERHDCERDRRAKVLVATDKGTETISRIMDALPPMFGCDELTDEEREQLHKILIKVTGFSPGAGLFAAQCNCDPKCTGECRADCGVESKEQSTK